MQHVCHTQWGQSDFVITAAFLFSNRTNKPSSQYAISVSDAEGDPLMEDYNTLFTEATVETGEPIETVVGYTPKHADIVWSNHIYWCFNVRNLIKIKFIEF